MELSRITCLALLVIAAGCSIKEEIGPVEESYGTVQVSVSDEGGTRSSLISGENGKTVAWSTDDIFHIYNVEDASSKDVHPVAVSADGFTATLPLPYPCGQGISIVITYGKAVFRADSTVCASSPVEQLMSIEGHDCLSMPMSSVIVPLESPEGLHLSLHPLNALVEMSLTGIPEAESDKIRNINIQTTVARGTRSRFISADKYIYMVGKDGFKTEITDYLSDKYIYDGDYAEYLELTSKELVGYGTGSVTAYFQSSGFVQPESDPSGTCLQSITIAITTDKHIVSKTFDNVADAKIKMTRGRITKFGLDMTGATVQDRLTASVEWSPGYLKYDSANKAYTFAGSEERGLYFKIGSLSGFDPFASVEAEQYFGTTKYLVYFKYRDEDKSRFETDRDLSWEDGTKDLVAYKKDDNGDIVPFSPASYEEIDYTSDVTYDRMKNDPCAYVKDGKSDWRLPTKAELQELADIIHENLGNWRVWSLGSETLSTTDRKPHMIEIIDKDGNSVTLSTTSIINQTHSMTTSGTYKNIWTYYVERAYSESIYLPSQNFREYITTKKLRYVASDLFMIGSLTSIHANYECDAKTVEGKTSYNAASNLSQGAMMVRCVRDRKEIPGSSPRMTKKSGTKMMPPLCNNK